MPTKKLQRPANKRFADEFELARKNCLKAINSYHRKNTASKEEVGHIAKMRKILLSRMWKIVHNCVHDERPDSIGIIYQALKGLHPRTHYEYPERIVVDFSDVLLTLKTVERGASRKNPEKLLEASIFLGLLQKDSQIQKH